MDILERIDQIFAAAGITEWSPRGGSRYGYGPWLRGREHVRFSATHVRHHDQFGVDFIGAQGIDEATKMRKTLELFGLKNQNRKPPATRRTYRWEVPPLEESVDIDQMRRARLVFEALFS